MPHGPRAPSACFFGHDPDPTELMTDFGIRQRRRSQRDASLITGWASLGPLLNGARKLAPPQTLPVCVKSFNPDPNFAAPRCHTFGWYRSNCFPRISASGLRPGPRIRSMPHLAHIIHEHFCCSPVAPHRATGTRQSPLRQDCMRLPRHAGGRARHSVPQRTVQVRLGPSRLHAGYPLLPGCNGCNAARLPGTRCAAIAAGGTRRTVMNNVG